MIPYTLAIMSAILKVMDLKFSKIKILSTMESRRIKWEPIFFIHLSRPRATLWWSYIYSRMLKDGQLWPFLDFSTWIVKNAFLSRRSVPFSKFSLHIIECQVGIYELICMDK